jgi:hypothetical protein
MLDSTTVRIVLLGSWGYSAKCIIQQCRKYDGTRFSREQIYRVLRENGIKLREYRDGENDVAKSNIKNLNKQETRLRIAG